MSRLAQWLRCPHCHQDLVQDAGTLRCPHRHSFDIAKQGYVNLSGRAAPANADTAAMLEARARFLARGHYQFIAEAASQALGSANRIVEAGAGTGYYLSQVLADRDQAFGLATDVSPAAAKRCARAHEQISSIVADTWAGLPLRDGCADAVLCVFAPRNMAEFRRVLVPGGTVVVVLPQAHHLAELRQNYGLLGVGTSKLPALVEDCGEILSCQDIEAQLSLRAEDVADLIAMGPNAFHNAPVTTAAITTTAAVSIVRIGF